LKKKQNIGKNNFHMEINISNEIILSILDGDLHARALARELKTNHMTIINKLKELIDRNVMDFKQRGKNKIYFLKKTIEAKNHVFMAEIYKLNKALKTYPVLRKIIETIRNDKKIKLAILFGSYAKGVATRDSDIDIYVESRDQNLKRALELFNSKLSVKIGAYNSAHPVIKEIEKNHVIIKGVELFYEKNKFFD
jgi:predicted nucleotidyltransferase